MTAYYNEIDPFVAQWLRNLTSQGHIAAGDVDERDIRDVRPSDLSGYRQCHFFAGIGGWSFAARLAGWDDDAPLWTGSCPCQPFSAAGQRAGFVDERHLWPDFFHLIRICRPGIVFGEQVAGPAGLLWSDLVQSDLEGEGYAFGADDLCAAGIEAPHIRQRLFWVANADGGNTSSEWQQRGRRQRQQPTDRVSGGMGDSMHAKRRASWLHGLDGDHRQNQGRPQACGDAGASNPVCGSDSIGGMDDANITGLQACEQRGLDLGKQQAGLSVEQPSHSPWADIEWLACRDGKYRPTQPGLSPLAHGVPKRVGRLRAYGNAIVPQVAAEFIKAWGEIVMECAP